MLIKQKDEISEQSSRLAVEKTQLQQRRKTRLTTSRNF